MTSQPGPSLQLGKAAGDWLPFLMCSLVQWQMIYCLQFQGEPTQIHAIFLFPFRIIPLVFRVSMTMSSTLPVLGLCWLLAPLLRAQSFAITKLADWEHLFDSICPITAHLHSNGAHNPICFQLVTCNHVQSVCEVVSGLSIHNFCMVNKPLRT